MTRKKPELNLSKSNHGTRASKQITPSVTVCSLSAAVASAHEGQHNRTTTTMTSDEPPALFTIQGAVQTLQAGGDLLHQTTFSPPPAKRPRQCLRLNPCSACTKEQVGLPPSPEHEAPVAGEQQEEVEEPTTATAAVAGAAPPAHEPVTRGVCWHAKQETWQVKVLLPSPTDVPWGLCDLPRRPLVGQFAHFDNAMAALNRAQQYVDAESSKEEEGQGTWTVEAAKRAIEAVRRMGQELVDTDRGGGYSSGTSAPRILLQTSLTTGYATCAKKSWKPVLTAWSAGRCVARTVGMKSGSPVRLLGRGGLSMCLITMGIPMGFSRESA
jgi:hypothetical protein